MAEVQALNDCYSEHAISEATASGVQESTHQICDAPMGDPKDIQPKFCLYHYLHRLPARETHQVCLATVMHFSIWWHVAVSNSRPKSSSS